MLQGIRDGQRERIRSDAASSGRSRSGQDAGVDEKPYYRKPRRSLKERLADSGIQMSDEAPDEESGAFSMPEGQYSF